MKTALCLSGSALIAFAIVINPWILGGLFSPDGSIGNPLNIGILIVIEIFIATAGVFLIWKPEILIRNKKDIVLSLLLFLIALLVLEGIARFIWKEPLGNVEGRYGYPAGLHRQDDVLGYAYVPHFSGTFPYPPYHTIPIETNSHGLRDYDHAYEKPAGTIRILGLGDSVTFGAGVRREDTYLSQLEQLLTSKGYEAEIIKAGVNRYAFDQEYFYYVEEGHKYDPDIVMVGIVLDDAEYTDIDAEKRRVQIYAMESYKYSLKKYCRLCDVFYAALSSPSPTQQKKVQEEHNLEYANTQLTTEWEENWDRFATQLQEFNKHVAQNDGTLVLVLFPYTEQFSASHELTNSVQEKIAAFAQSMGVVVIDTLPVLDVPHYKDLYLKNDHVHPNPKGHALIAHTILEQLASARVLTHNTSE